MWQNIDNAERFYFVHSYYTRPQDEAAIAARADYGVEFACALARPNLFAVQVHPEKRQYAGLQLLRNFVHWNGES